GGGVMESGSAGFVTRGGAPPRAGATRGGPVCGGAGGGPRRGGGGPPPPHGQTIVTLCGPPAPPVPAPPRGGRPRPPAGGRKRGAPGPAAGGARALVLMPAVRRCVAVQALTIWVVGFVSSSWAGAQPVEATAEIRNAGGVVLGHATFSALAGGVGVWIQVAV